MPPICWIWQELIYQLYQFMRGGITMTLLHLLPTEMCKQKYLITMKLCL